ncbi:MAG: hypothetical protein QOC79_1635 [Actinomycetota bacterium]|jgi:hypothetical protein|nr:hypothetical protein [Actinomycetota bacterium]
MLQAPLTRSPRHDSEARYRAIIAIARERAALRCELKYQRLDGSRPWAMLELNSSPADHRRPDSMRAMFTDVSRKA